MLDAKMLEEFKEIPLPPTHPDGPHKAIWDVARVSGTDDVPEAASDDLNGPQTVVWVERSECNCGCAPWQPHKSSCVWLS